MSLRFGKVTVYKILTAPAALLVFISIKMSRVIQRKANLIFFIEDNGLKHAFTTMDFKRSVHLFKNANL